VVSIIARSVEKLVIRVVVLVGWCNTYEGRKVSRVAMCEVVLFKHSATSNRSRAILVLMKSRPQLQPPDSHANMATAMVAAR
jgi:hypothetical protein